MVRDYFAPDALEDVDPDVVRFSPVKGTTNSMGAESVKFELWRRKAEARLPPDGSRGLPGRRSV